MGTQNLAWLLTLLVVTGCERDAVPDETPPPAEQMASYLALGDSYTIGEGVQPEDRWPVVLAGVSSLAAPTIVARTGWTVRELDAGIDAATLADDYAVVTLLIGVNDEFRGGDVETYRAEFSQMLDRALGFGGDDPQRLTVVSIPDYGVTPFGRSRGGDISARIDAFNTAARQETEARDAAWVDVTELSRAMPDAVVRDGLHPDAEQYAAWADQVAGSLSTARK
jgi:lysophospholipase L1-like esterase